MRNRGEKNLILHRRFIQSYKKNTMAIFFSFALTFLLLTTMLGLIHTNHRIANIQDKTVFTPSDCYLSGLSYQQIKQLKAEQSLDHLGVEQQREDTYVCNNQLLFFTRGDHTTITMMSTVIEGRLPEKEGEVVAEKWILLNLGIQPAIGQNLTIWNSDTEKPKKLKVVGILSDMYQHKRYGTLNLYTPLEGKKDGKYIAYLHFKDGINYDAKMKKLQSELGIEKKQIKVCPAREDFVELYQTDAKVMAVILLIGMVVFYGIYRITSITRQKQYGILRAVGMKRKQLYHMILLELYQIFSISAPVGIGFGVLTAFFIVSISGNKEDIYLYNTKILFPPIIPVGPILICVILVAAFIGIVGAIAGRNVISAPVVETISGVKSSGREKRSVCRIGKSRGKMSTLFFMACKYLFRDAKTSSFVVLTICLGVTLFTGLAYRTQVLKTYREDTKAANYLNGQYQMSMLNFNHTEQGISRQSAAKLLKIEDIVSMKTESGIPIRVVDEDNVKRNDAYYNQLNQNLYELYGYSNVGKDGTNQIYKSVLYGYNHSALESLKKYVIEGDYNPNHIKEDEIILSVLRTDDTKQDDTPGIYKEGTPLMQYKVGDSIKIKYRADLNTSGLDYDKLTDQDAVYQYKTYKIAAIVSFEYMYNCKRTVYPLLITSDQEIQKIAPDSAFQCIYLDAKSNMSLRQQTLLEQRLIQIGARNKEVATRSLISEIQQNEMFYFKQMVYVYGIAAVAFVLVMINMINNLRYRMQTRTKEICMLRAIGMSIAMAKRMLLFENMVLGMVSVVVAFFLSQPVLRYLYQISDMRAFGHAFQYDYAAFAVVSVVALAICAVLSLGILKSWKTRYILEGIGNVE